MPAPYKPHHPYPGSSYTLGHAAKAGQLVVVRCSHCRRLTRFLASDLVEVLGEHRDALEPPFPCSKCGLTRYVSVKLHIPREGDYGHLPVRRPAGVVTIQKWRTVRLGD